MFLERLKNTNNIYDMISTLYERLIKEDEGTYINKFFQNKDSFGDLMEEVVVYSESTNKSEALPELIESICAWMRENQKLEAQSCAALIYKIDSILPPDTAEYKLSPRVTRKIGPLNSAGFQENILVFPSTNETLFHNFLHKADKDIKFRQTNSFERGGINIYLHNYIILDKQELHRFTPRIHKFNDSGEFRKLSKSENGIKIALIPFTCGLLLDMKYEGDTFSITGAKPEYDIFITERYMAIIDNLEKEGVNIAVFPEMVLTSNALEKLKEHMRKNTFNSIKLIFCGTMWSDNSNICHIITNTGEQVLMQKKFTPFSLKKDGRKYNENLQHYGDKYIEILDIDGLGRVFTAICIDFLNESNMFSLIKQLRSNVAMVPAYSGSLDNFMANTDSFARLYNGMTILCNCCKHINTYKSAQLKNGENVDVGYIAVPSIDKTTFRMESKYFSYYMNKECSEKCNKESCAYIYKLLPQEVSDTDNTYTIKVELNKVP